MKRKRKKVGKCSDLEGNNMLQKSLRMQTVQITPEDIHQFIEEFLEQTTISHPSATKIYIAVDEIVANILQYSGAKTLDVSCNATAENVTLSFSDDGIPYNPLEREDPDVTLSAEERAIGGLGIFMVKNMMDAMEYAYRDGRNILTVTKNTK